MSHPHTPAAALAVSSLGLKFPFVPQLVEVISTTTSDIPLPLGLRVFWFFVFFFLMLVTVHIFQNLSQPGQQVFLG